MENQTSHDSLRYTDIKIQKTWWARLPFGVRMTIGTVALLLLCVAGVLAVVALIGGEDARTAARSGSVTPSGLRVGATSAAGSALAGLPGTPGGVDAGVRLGDPPGLPAVAAAPAVGVDGVGAGVTAPSAAPPLAAPPSGVATVGVELPIGGTPVDPVIEYESVGNPPASTTPPPVVETATVTETEAIPFDTRYVRDRSMPWRTRAVRTPGEQGVRSLTYEVTTTDGQQTGKRFIAESVTKQPVTQVIAIGTGRRCNGGGDGHHDGGDGNGDYDKKATC